MSNLQNTNKILIIDFGSQLTQLIARRVRQLQVYCEVLPYDVTSEDITRFNPQGVILSGGPNSTYEDDTPKAPEVIFTLNVPILGICYGMQTMALQMGGMVTNSPDREFGFAKIYNITSQLFDGINHDDNSTNDINDVSRYMNVWMSHGDKVTAIPYGFEVIGSTSSCPVAAMVNHDKKYYGVQFHPEVTHTQDGIRLLQNFVCGICKITPSWNMPNFLNNTVAQIKKTVGNEHVILALSGGVDSSVAAALIDRAIGKNLTCIFVDTGLLRYNEALDVMRAYRENLGLNIIKIDASARFYDALSGVTEPEAKRKIIGKLFIDIFEEEAHKITSAKFLAQGTIYPDVIESAKNSKSSHNIKSHHNVGGLPDTLKLALLEPLRELFKDEVRNLGMELGLPHHMVYRHPFPGPGLALRIIGEIKTEYVKLLQLADKIFIEELRKNGYYDKVSQAFAVFLPIKTVGVMGDSRTYDYVIALRSVNTSDFMTANSSELPFSLLTNIANRITNEIKGVSRVVYDISSKPPATIEWE